VIAVKKMNRATVQLAYRNMKKSQDLAMRIASTWFVVFWMAVGLAWGQEGNTADDVRKGHQLAAMLCGMCHVAAPDQPFMPTSNPPAPSFESITQRKDINATSLQTFITTTHRGLDSPKGMPYPYLADYQVKQVVAYLLSLRK
jgi:mono/diheme cytochrome c family protein